MISALAGALNLSKSPIPQCTLLSVSGNPPNRGTAVWGISVGEVMPKRIGDEVLGAWINRLQVIGVEGVDHAGKSIARFQCHCGVEFVARYSNVKGGNTTSCGCEAGRFIKSLNYKHGLSRDPRYQVWVDMHKRCYNPLHPCYEHYGGRGITVCEQWHHTPEKFFDDIGPRPDGYALDRLDNNAGYSPENCAWVTIKQQQNNRRNNVWLTLGGETRTLSGWAELAGVHRSSFRNWVVKGTAEADLLARIKCNAAVADLFKEAN